MLPKYNPPKTIEKRFIPLNTLDLLLFLSAHGNHCAGENKPYAQVAQLVEQRTENPRVAGSIPALGTPISTRKGNPDRGLKAHTSDLHNHSPTTFIITQLLPSAAA